MRETFTGHGVRPMSEWHGDGTTLKKASAVRRGDRISVDGNLLEVISIRPTGHPEDVESIRNPKSLEVKFINGKSVLYRPDEDVMILDI